jgi:hypothetical protein
MNYVQTSSHIYTVFILILSSHLRTRLRNTLLSSGFRIKHTRLIFPMPVTRSVRRTLLDLITLIIFGAEYNLLKPLHNSLQSPVTSSPLRTNILVCAHNQCSSLNVRGQARLYEKKTKTTTSAFKSQAPFATLEMNSRIMTCKVVRPQIDKNWSVRANTQN